MPPLTLKLFFATFLLELATLFENKQSYVKTLVGMNQ